jgi:hypothetical protein
MILYHNIIFGDIFLWSSRQPKEYFGLIKVLITSDRCIVDVFMDKMFKIKFVKNIQTC